MAKGDAYFGWHNVISVILAVIPITSLILGIITRVIKKSPLSALLNFLAAPYFWVVDLITVIVYRDLLLVDVKF